MNLTLFRFCTNLALHWSRSFQATLMSGNIMINQNTYPSNVRIMQNHISGVLWILIAPMPIVRKLQKQKNKTNKQHSYLQNIMRKNEFGQSLKIKSWFLLNLKSLDLKSLQYHSQRLNRNGESFPGLFLCTSKWTKARTFAPGHALSVLIQIKHD